ncbi:hypothetical protein HK103_002960 [Boothiomyces macroporosus]|uniref:Eukaryotic translation initiation factor 2A n=1 Tax=Boothiomyces macroporosus TaxID=261099 RepID=A0AAD5UMU0_9FUNG|nr:hypothetical protein HK103_002960 [Boothiomyces macroporosus]
MTTQICFLSNSGLNILNSSDQFKGNTLTFEKDPKNFKYSPNGNFLVVILNSSVQVYAARPTLTLAHEFDITNIIDFSFSPKDNYLSILTRYGNEILIQVKPKGEEEQHKNMTVWDLRTGESVLSFTQKVPDGWNVEWTEDESFCAKLFTQELRIYDSKKFAKGPSQKVKFENISSFSISPGKRPIVAAFFPEKKGSPGACRLYDLTNLNTPLSQKSFYRAETVTFHWNSIGTNVLIFTHTDVDKTGQSYYGETSLYYLSITGNFDCRVEFDHPGPIHDVAWSPNAKEFIVTYGTMPSKTTLFDHRASPIYHLEKAPRNTVKYSPTGRFFFVAGFGNLAGDMDVYERKSFKKVASIAASNSSACEWSPDGRHIMTSILYRRLKVDNGLKIWHYSGVLTHEVETKEMYLVAWRPESASLWPERNANSPIPQGVKPPAPAKAVGKYIPPGARRSANSASIYNRDEIDKGVSPSSPGLSRGRSIPGLNKPQSGKQKPAQQTPQAQPAVNSRQAELEKKVKNINKKLKQIEELKLKRDSGAKMELTQLSKIDTEPALHKELNELFAELKI